jgi:hypothetical protein
MTSAMDNLGPHLLGRKPLPRDDRDYHLEDYLDSHRQLADTLTPQTTLAELNWTHWADAYAIWAWIKANLLNAPPVPTPPAPAGPVEWADTDNVLDQGQTPRCVGFTGADWLNTLPVDDHVGNAMGDQIYAACKVVDGEPGAQDGSTTRSLCKVLKQMGRIGAYAFTTNAATVVAYVAQHGPVMTGIPWMNAMFTPDQHGYLHPTGGIAGGHEISVIGESATGYGAVADPSVEILNHWGAAWGKNGRAYLTVTAYQSLLSQGGDAAAGLELPLPR